MNNNTLYVFIDGADGVGKSSFMQGLVKKLKTHGQSVMVTHIIKHTEFGKKFYQEWTEGVHCDVEGAHRMLQATVGTIQELSNMKESYDVVIVDRSQASFYAYQMCNSVVKQNLAVDFYNSLEVDFYWKNRIVNIYLHCDPTITARRMLEGRGALDHIEKRGVVFQQTVASEFEICFKRHPSLRPQLRINTGIMGAAAVCDVGFDFLKNKIKETTQ